MEQEEKYNPGKPWKITNHYKTFEEADQKREELKKIWSDNNVEGMQIKVNRRNSTQGFVVKTRLHPDFELKLEKENKRGKRKNRKSRKRNSTERGFEFDKTSI